jgi:hypothetical protein
MRGRYREARPIRDAIRHLLVQSGYGGVDALSQSSGDGQLPPALAVPKLEDQPTDGSGRAGDAALDEPRAIVEFERLLAYHWEDDRQEFYARARTLYDWAEHRPVLRQWMAERVATVSQNVRPSLSHLKLWPLAFLLGQDAHLIDLGERDGRYTACLYRGRFYGIPSGRHLTPALVETHGSSELISAPSLSELRALFACADGATDQADAFPLRPISGLDVPWLVPSEVRLAGSHGSYNIVAYLGCFWGLPQELGAVDLSRRQDRARPGIILAPSYEELIARIDARSKVRRRPTEGANHPQC